MRAADPSVCGVLVIDKSSGMTSHDVVGRIRRLYGTRQVGHTGTLDPMATGVLVILLGRAAKAAEYIVAGEKGYKATIRLGVKTDTGDITGKILEKSDNIADFNALKAVLPRFTGKIQQIPPMYSAIKVGGKKLYELARQGVEIEREPRQIEIFSIEAAQTDRADEFTLDVKCSKGTYIRSLCEDIGESLGCHGTMAALRRSESGGFALDSAYTLEYVESLSELERMKLLKPTEQLFANLPAVKPNEFFVRLMRAGAQLYQSKLGISYPVGQMLRMYDGDTFVALGEVRDYPEGSAIKPIKMFDLE